MVTRLIIINYHASMASGKQQQSNYVSRDWNPFYSVLREELNSNTDSIRNFFGIQVGIGEWSTFVSLCDLVADFQQAFS